MGEFRAFIAREWQRDIVRLMVSRRIGSHADHLMPDGTWRTVEEGSSLEDEGIELPAGSVEAIAVALQEFQGHTSHADTEARVLREWLAAEMTRVDAALRRPTP
jgi:hypothetical protein